MPQQLPTGEILLDAFPFDSNPNTITTVNGYVKGDRSVDAWTMRNAFRQFFSNGVFGTPSNAFQISKGGGLSVTVQPGMCVIEGAMGGIEGRNGAVTLALDSGAAAGNVCYGIFLRYDDNSDTRGIVLDVRKGEAASSPTPPAPDRDSANVFELRLGYVTVPNGATTLENATVTNEKGLDVCPYASAFNEIDLSEVVSDAKNSGVEALSRLLEYFDTYRDAIDAALSGEEATYLQQQINQLKEQMTSVDLSTSVDNETIEYAQKLPEEIDEKLRVKDGAITSGKLADFSVLPIKLSADLQIQLGVLDQTGWDFDQYMEFVGSLDDDTKKSYLQSTFDMSVFNDWTVEQREEFTHSLDGECFDVFFERVDLDGFTWTDLVEYANSFTGQSRSKFVGKQKTVNSHLGSSKFICVGVDHYQNVKGLVFYGKGQKGIYNDGNREALYKNSKLYSYSQATFLNSMDQELQNLLKTCPIVTHGYSDNPPAIEETLNLKIWTPSSSEIVNWPTAEGLFEGTQYQYFAEGGAASGIAPASWTRTVGARASYGNAGNEYVYMIKGTFPSGSGVQSETTYQSREYPRNVAFCV